MCASSSTTRRCFFIEGKSGIGCRGPFSDGQPQGEGASAAFARAIGDLAIVLASETLCESEAEAAALDAAGERIVRAVEGLKDLALLARRDTDAAVEHADADVVVVEVGMEVDLLAVAAVFLGVG